MPVSIKRRSANFRFLAVVRAHDLPARSSSAIPEGQRITNRKTLPPCSSCMFKTVQPIPEPDGAGAMLPPSPSRHRFDNLSVHLQRQATLICDLILSGALFAPHLLFLKSCSSRVVAFELDEDGFQVYSKFLSFIRYLTDIKTDSNVPMS